MNEFVGASPQASTVSDATEGRRESTVRRLVSFAESYALLILLGAVALFFCLWPQTSSTFPTVANLQILVSSQAVIGVIALGALLPLLVQEFDLSVGAVARASAIFVAAYLSAHGNLLIGLLLTLLIGVTVGTVNALLVTRAHVSGVITTLGMSTIIAGAVLQKTGGLALASDVPAGLTSFGTGLLAGIPLVFIMLIVVATVVYVVLAHTTFGRAMYALGSNAEAAKLVGLRTNLIRGIALVAASTLSAVGGAALRGTCRRCLPERWRHIYPAGARRRLLERRCSTAGPVQCVGNDHCDLLPRSSQQRAKLGWNAAVLQRLCQWRSAHYRRRARRCLVSTSNALTELVAGASVHEIRRRPERWGQ